MNAARARIVPALLIALALPAQAPLSPDGFIASRQGEVARYAKLLFHFDLGDSHWTHRRLGACPSLTHHAFAVYERASSTGTDRFLVSYNLDAPPAKSKDRPWQGGIVAQPLGAEWGTASGTRPDEASLITLFNHVLADEKHLSQSAAATGGSEELAACFAAIAGEQPASPLAASPSPASPPTASPQPGPTDMAYVDATLFAVTSRSATRRFQVVHFDQRGFVEYARVALEQIAAP